MSIVNGQNVTPQVLKNRGIPAKFHALEQVASGRWVRKFDEAGEPQFETAYLQMTNAVLADIEDDVVGWGGLEKWQEALSTKPFSTLGATVALMRDWRTTGDLPDKKRAGASMIDGGVADYSVAVGSSFMLANGAPEEQVGKQLVDSLAEAVRTQKVQWDKLFADPDNATLTPLSSDTPGTPGELPGASSAAPSTSSGD